MRRLVLLTLFALTACPPPVEPECQRVLVDVNGNTNRGFAGGIGGGTGNTNASPLGVTGVEQTLTLFAPLSSCVSDTLRADVTVLDPDNQPLAPQRGVPARLGVEGAVKMTVTFTPAKPGTHSIHVAFEPSLGVRTLLLDVAADGLAGLTTRVPIPTGANCLSNALWPLTDDTVACEERGRGQVSITSSDGGLTQFPGEQLVVVDTVLWSINAASSSLERRVFEDGGVRLTDAFANFPAVATPGMHDVDLALRFRTNGRLNLVRLGRSIIELPLDGQVGPPLAYFAEDDDTVFRWSQVDCGFGCTNFPDLVAVEPGFVWRGGDAFGQVPGGARVSGFVRPTAQSDTLRFSLPHQPEPVSTPAFGFERIPLWLGVSGKRVLVSVQNEALVFTAWPATGVLRVGRRHVVLTDPALDFVRVARR